MNMYIKLEYQIEQYCEYEYVYKVNRIYLCLKPLFSIEMILSGFIVADQIMLSGTLRSVPEASVIPLSCQKFVCAATYRLPGITKNPFNDVGIQTAWAHLLIFLMQHI